MTKEQADRYHVNPDHPQNLIYNYGDPKQPYYRMWGNEHSIYDIMVGRIEYYRAEWKQASEDSKDALDELLKIKEELYRCYLANSPERTPEGTKKIQQTQNLYKMMKDKWHTHANQVIRMRWMYKYYLTMLNEANKLFDWDTRKELFTKRLETRQKVKKVALASNVDIHRRITYFMDKLAEARHNNNGASRYLTAIIKLPKTIYNPIRVQQIREGFLVIKDGKTDTPNYKLYNGFKDVLFDVFSMFYKYGGQDYVKNAQIEYKFKGDIDY